MNKVVIIIATIIIFAGGGIFLYSQIKNEKDYQEPTNEVNKNSTSKEEEKKKENNQEEIKEFVKEKTALDINSQEIQDLYNKVTFKYSILDNYLYETLTNNTIITLTAELMSNQNLYTCNESDIDRECVLDMNQFQTYAKMLFGPNVQYNLNTYKDDYNGCGGFKIKENQIYLANGSGCEVDENIISSIDSAYKTENKIVIIEKTLLSISMDKTCDIKNICYSEEFKLQKGIYTNLKDHKFISDKDIYFNNPFDTLDLLSRFATYYAYTFTKSNDGNYYYTNFERIKK